MNRILIKNNRNADALEQTLKYFGAWVEREGIETPSPGTPPRIVDGCMVVCCTGDAGYLKFAMQNQGYAEVVRELEEKKG